MRKGAASQNRTGLKAPRLHGGAQGSGRHSSIPQVPGRGPVDGDEEAKDGGAVEV